MGKLHLREAGPEDGPVVVLLHGYPESSYMWEGVIPRLADAGHRALAPDFAGFGDSPADPPGTWERHVEAFEAFRLEQGLDRIALVVHDWGGLIGLRWACEHPEAVRALVISSTGFFPDGKWNGLAMMLRTEGQGEEWVQSTTREGFRGMLQAVSPGIDDAAADEYFKAFGDADRRRGQLELYRSGDFEKLVPYEGGLAALGVPTLLIWGDNDPFSPIAGANRLLEEIPGSRLVTLDGAGHLLVDDAPDRYAAELVAFLGEASPPAH